MRQEKISESLLMFAAPILEGAGDELTVESMERVLMICKTVWNSMVIATWHGDDRFLKPLEEKASKEVDRLPLLGYLLDRWQEHFAHEDRVIGEISVKPGDGELIVRAEVVAYSPQAPD